MKKSITLICCTGCILFAAFTASAQKPENKPTPAAGTKAMNPAAPAVQPDDNVLKPVTVPEKGHLLPKAVSTIDNTIPGPPLPKPIMSNMSPAATAAVPAEIKKPVILQEQPKQH